ncbi:MAG: hypothetical protein J1E61_03550 [Lachnospiraceae bacterium]|nr:hypothetical protein [Lachnospiraceae bacterium]
MKKRILISGVLALSIVLLFACGQEDHGNAEVTEIPEISQNEIEEEVYEEEETAPESEKPFIEQEASGIIPTTEGYEIMTLTEEEREGFLKKYDFPEQEPYYTYYDEKGRLQLELWFDEANQYGGGIRYVRYPNSEGEVSLGGFVFYEINRDFESDVKSDPYDWEEEADGVQGYIDNEWIWQYEENKKYNAAGRLSFYEGTCVTDFYSEDPQDMTVLQGEYTYRKDGSLLSCYRFRSDMIFGTWGHTKTSWYDEKEREIYSTQYITHGSLEDYYIYEGESETPLCVLELDNDLGRYYPYFSYLVSEENINVPDYDDFFEKNGSSYSCAVFYHPEQDTYDIYNEYGYLNQCFTRHSPFGTFNIPAVVLAMQYGILDEEDEIDSQYYRDINDFIGENALRNGLMALNYGNSIVNEDNFYRGNCLKVSPMEQVEFFVTLFEGGTDLSEKELWRIKDLMYVQEAGDYSVYGTYSVGNYHESWFAGFYEKNGERTYFAIYLGQNSEETAKDTLISILSENE